MISLFSPELNMTTLHSKGLIFQENKPKRTQKTETKKKTNPKTQKIPHRTTTNTRKIREQGKAGSWHSETSLLHHRESNLRSISQEAEKFVFKLILCFRVASTSYFHLCLPENLLF